MSRDSSTRRRGLDVSNVAALVFATVAFLVSIIYVSIEAVLPQLLSSIAIGVSLLSPVTGTLIATLALIVDSALASNIIIDILVLVSALMIAVIESPAIYLRDKVSELLLALLFWSYTVFMGIAIITGISREGALILRSIFLAENGLTTALLIVGVLITMTATWTTSPGASTVFARKAARYIFECPMMPLLILLIIFLALTYRDQPLVLLYFLLALITFSWARASGLKRSTAVAIMLIVFFSLLIITGVYQTIDPILASIT